MGLLDTVLKVGAPILGSVLGGVSAKSANSTPGQSATSTQAIDPRMAGLLYGGQSYLKPGVTPTYSVTKIPGPNNNIKTQNNPASDYATSQGLYPAADQIFAQNMAQGYIGQNDMQNKANDWQQYKIADIANGGFFDQAMTNGTNIGNGQFDSSVNIDPSTARATQGSLCLLYTSDAADE